MFTTSVSTVPSLEPRNERPAPTGPQSGPTFEALLAKTEETKSSRPVAATRTRLSENEARDALAQAWTERFGSPPSEETSAILTAQWAHETGFGQSMWNFNFAGIKGKGPTGLYVSQKTKEGYGETEQTIRDNFRAYESKEAGARDYLDLLSRRYGSAVNAAASGDPEGFVRELKKGGYFTGSEAAYTRSVSNLTATFLGRAPEISPREVATVNVAETSASPSRIAAEPKAFAALAKPHEGPSLAEASHADGRVHRDRLASLEDAVTMPNLELFHEALSRAALRIALSSESSEEKFL